jgi:hypothetical protein
METTIAQFSGAAFGILIAYVISLIVERKEAKLNVIIEERNKKELERAKEEIKRNLKRQPNGLT